MSHITRMKESQSHTLTIHVTHTHVPQDEKIDDLVNEDLSELMPEGGEEFYYTGTDQQNRPVLIYRSCAHTPGRVDPK